METIRLINASFSYDGKTNIFTDLSCEISSENIFCILGPNGVGKSTLLNGIMNLLPLNSGRVMIGDKDLKRYSPEELARKIAYIPQTYNMVFPYNVIDLVLMGRTPHLNDLNRPSAEDFDITMAAIAELGLEPFIKRPCTELSGGQLQMVMLARAIAQEAEFLILDEPTSHLDYGRQMDTLKMISKMHKRGVGVIFTSHNPDHAFMVCDKVAIMNNGTFEKVGPPNEVITEESLSEIYNIKMQILAYGENKSHRVCTPLQDDIDEW